MKNREPNLALFIDFDNVAIGARDAGLTFDVKVVLARLLDKGKIVVKKAYADWSRFKDATADLHAAAIELIEIPKPRQSGKNSADIRLVVDAMDLCYAKDHIDAFVIVSGDSDFSPLVSKLRENDKGVVGLGMKGSTSALLIANCDEFIFYDDLVRAPVTRERTALDAVPAAKRKTHALLLETVEGLLQEQKGIVHSSLVKDTMKRKKPDFSERARGYGSFGELLEEAMGYGLLTIERDERAGGSYLVSRLGAAKSAAKGATKKAAKKKTAKKATKKTVKKTAASRRKAD